MRLQSLNHNAYQHQYHIVWGTKYRRKIIKEYVRDVLVRNIRQTIKEYPALYLHTINTDQDHIHLQIEIPPNMSVAAAVQLIKGRSSIVLKNEFKFIREMYVGGSIWSAGYFSSTIGLNESQIKKYILWQGKKDIPRQTRFGAS